MTPGSLRTGETFDRQESYAAARGVNPAGGRWKVVITANASNVDDVSVAINVYRRTYPIAPDALTLSSPANGTTVRWGQQVTFAWSAPRGATSYDLLLDGAPIATGLTRPTVTFPFKSNPGAHKWQIVARNAFGTATSLAQVINVLARGDAVIVTGFMSTTPETRPGQCANLLGFAELCRRLALAGLNTYSIAAAKEDHAADHINTLGSVELNAAHLGRFVAEKLPKGSRPIFVGHSMGGLISRTAVARRETAGAGLITLGTPYDGSFEADAVIAAVTAHCGALGVFGCLAAQLEAKAITHAFGLDAMSDMTRLLRTVANLLLGSLPVPVWALAGSGAQQPVGNWREPWNYYFPNDVAVGVSSALGQNSGLALDDQHRIQIQAWHVDDVPLAPTLKLVPMLANHAGNTVYDDPKALNWVYGAIDATLTGRRSIRGARQARADTSTTVAQSATKSYHVSVPAQTTLRASRQIPSGTGIVISSETFSVRCNGVTWPATVIAESLVAADPAALGCHGATITGAGPARIIRTANPAKVRVNLRRTSTGARIVITGHARLSRATIALTGSTQRLHDRSPRGRRIVANVHLDHKRTARVVVQAHRRSYTAVIGT